MSEPAGQRVEIIQRKRASMWRPIVATIVIMCFLSFVGGAFIADFQIFPYRFVFKDAFAYLHARQERRSMEAEAKAEIRHAASAGKGHVTMPTRSGAWDGYTFMTYDTARPSTARLIDMQGNVLHEWHRSFRDIWPHPPHKRNPSSEDAISWRYGQLLPNGDIIVTVVSYGDTPYGYGLVKLDKDSKVVWAVPDNFHHQFSIGDDGSIYGLTHQWRDTHQQPVHGDAHLPARVLEDFVVKVSADGKELSRVSLLEALTASGYGTLLDSSISSGFDTKAWDPVHANDVEVVNGAFASHYSFMKPGMVLVSLRDLDALVLLDLSTQRITWATRGAWVRQHDPDLLNDGNILLFDNRGDNVNGGASRIIEFEPESGEVVWSYAGSAAKPFSCDKSGGQERLPNGDTLISDDHAGRIFEVDHGGDIMWEYQDVRMHEASRVAKDWLTFVPHALLARNPAGAPTTQVSADASEFPKQ